MADHLTELDDLINSFAEGDRQAARDLLTRNQSASSLLASQSTVYKAFVDGDPVRLAAAQAAATVVPPAAVVTPPAATVVTPPAATPPPAAAQPIGLTLDQINVLLNEREKNIDTRLEARAKEIAAAELNAARAGLIGQGAELADQIASIRETHRSEFNEPLDSAKFKEFYATEGPKYGNKLVDTYNAFVSEKRFEARVAREVETRAAARETGAVPGSSLPGQTNPSPLSSFIDFNVKKTTPTATPSADVDKAAQAFNAMRAGWTN